MFEPRNATSVRPSGGVARPMRSRPSSYDASCVTTSRGDDRRQRQGRGGERGGRDVDEVQLSGREARRCGGQERRQLLAASGSELHQTGWGVGAIQDGPRMRPQQPELRTRHVVPRKPGDGFEERGPQRVVEKARGQLTGPPRQVEAHFACELGEQRFGRTRRDQRTLGGGAHARLESVSSATQRKVA